MTATRRRAREWAVQMLTAADLNPPADVRAFMDEYWLQIETLPEDDGGTGGEKVRGKLKLFAEERVQGVLSCKDELDDIIVPLLENWELYRLGTVERMVMRMGIWELKSTDVPKGAVINEAVDLVNWFSSPKSRMIVNAVLDKFARKG